jgi:hypothetical protein
MNIKFGKPFLVLVFDLFNGFLNDFMLSKIMITADCYNRAVETVTKHFHSRIKLGLFMTRPISSVDNDIGLFSLHIVAQFVQPTARFVAKAIMGI